MDPLLYGFTPEMLKSKNPQRITEELRQLQDIKSPEISEARKEFLLTVRDQDNEVTDLVNNLSFDFGNVMGENTKKDSLINQAAVISGFAFFLKVFGGDFGSTVQENARLAVSIKGGEILSDVIDRYGNNKNLFDDIVKLEDFVKTYPNVVFKNILNSRFPLDDKSIGDRIVSLQGQALEVTKSIVAIGINQGKSAKQIAADIDSYLMGGDKLKGVSAFQWVKDAEGIIKQKKLDFKPTGTVSSNSLRIARTEINMAYRRATLEINDGQPWNNGFDWVLSPSHLGPDICDDWARGGPYTLNDIPRGHPHCMCDVRSRSKKI